MERHTQTTQFNNRLEKNEMNNEQKRSIRIMKLTELSQKGKTEAQLRGVCKRWGVTDKTENSYIKAVYARLEKVA